MKRRYLDYSATTPVKKEVLDEMIPYFTKTFGNASSIHTFGQIAKEVLEESRVKVAKTINAKESEIFFTSGGTESDNWALKSIAKSNQNRGKHIITTKIEHHAILHSCQSLEKEGYEITYLDVDEYGYINMNDLKNSIRKDTIIISIMFINNEIGTIQNIKEIGLIAKDNDVLFHTDAVQALGNIKIDVNELNVDLLSISSHKIYGPKGVGALYIKRGVRIVPFMDGGAQERKKRAGTENIPAIVGFAKACEIAERNLESHIEKLSNLRDDLIEKILNNIDDVKLNGPRDNRHPGNVNVAFKYIEGEALLLMLDAVGIAASSGSACTAGSLEPSHVLMSIGLGHEIAHGSLRLTVGDFTESEDIDFIVENLVRIVQTLREMSPLYES
ncbi:MAG: cysteine desulfurase NifS [Bacillota bacterium]|nr:cysteine desulfurase NifS [Bacillota bacterium]